jgi:hypothetical protein
MNQVRNSLYSSIIWQSPSFGLRIFPSQEKALLIVISPVADWPALCYPNSPNSPLAPIHRFLLRWFASKPVHGPKDFCLDRTASPLTIPSSCPSRTQCAGIPCSLQRDTAASLIQIKQATLQDRHTRKKGKMGRQYWTNWPLVLRPSSAYVFIDVAWAPSRAINGFFKLSCCYPRLSATHNITEVWLVAWDAAKLCARPQCWGVYHIDSFDTLVGLEKVFK